MYALTPCRSWSTNEGSLAVIPVYQQGCRDTAHFPRHILMQGAWSGSCRSVLVFQPTSGANDLPFQICKNFRGISSDIFAFQPYAEEAQPRPPWLPEQTGLQRTARRSVSTYICNGERRQTTVVPHQIVRAPRWSLPTPGPCTILKGM